MSHVSECIALYFADAEVSDKDYAALIADAMARDTAEGNLPEGVAALATSRTPGEVADAMLAERYSVQRTLDGLALAIELLNRLDDQRTERLAALEHQVEGLARAIGSEVEHSRKAEPWTPKRVIADCRTCGVNQWFTEGKCDVCASPLVRMVPLAAQPASEPCPAVWPTIARPCAKCKGTGHLGREYGLAECAVCQGRGELFGGAS